MKVGKKVRNRLFPVLLAVIMAFGMMPTAAFGLEEDAAAGGSAQFADMPDNWSTKALQNAVANGLLGGDDGRIMPDQNLTRAQMAAVITRAFGSTVKGDVSGFTDVKPADWFADSLAKAYQMGAIKGSGSQMNPNSAITRQEVFVILARAFKLQPADKMNKTFGDADKIAGWAKGEVYAFVNAGYIQGAGGKLNPSNLITRAEFAQIFDNILKQYINMAGEYTQVADGNVMVNVPGVTLKNLKVNGDLIIGDGVGNGEVTLDSVAVTGRMVVRGGGENSIIIKGSSSVSNVVIARVDGAVSVKVQGDAIVEVVYIDDGSDDVSLQGTFGNVEVAAPEIVVNAVGATVNNIAVAGEGAKLVVDSASKIAFVAIQAPNTQIAGTGTVTKVEAQTGATGSKIETPNTQISVGAGVSGVTGGGGTKVEAGTTTNNNASGTGTTGPTAPLPTGGSNNNNNGTPALTVSDVTVNNASSVTFKSAASPSTVTWNGTAVTAGNISYKAADQTATVTVPKITSITNTLVVSASGYTSTTVPVGITKSAGNLILIKNKADLEDAVVHQADGQSWLLKNGTYDTQRFSSINAGGQTGWYFPITGSDISITGETKNGAVLTSSVQSENGVWASQDQVSVWGDNVTIANLTIKSKITPNKAIEVMGRNFTIRNVDFVQRDDLTYQFGGSLFFNPSNKDNDIGTALVENVLINDAWISCSPQYVSDGALTIKNTTIDFRGCSYANYDYGVFSKNDAVDIQIPAGSYFKVLADNAPNLQTQILDKVPSGTAVILAAGTYYMRSYPVVPAGVTLDKTTNNVVIKLLDADTALVKNDSEFKTALNGTAPAIQMVPGTYEFNANIRITRAVTIIGDGNSTVITKGDAAWVNNTGSKGYAPLITVNSGDNAVRLENIKVTGADNIAMTGAGAGKTDYGSGINIVSSSNVVLKNVTSADNEAAGLIVNSSSVSAINLNTSGNGWYGVNVDKADSGNASFTLSGSGVIAEKIQIISDKTDGASVTAEGYAPYKFEGTTITRWQKGEMKNIASITSGGKTMYYETIKAAIDAAVAGADTVVLAKGTYDITDKTLEISKNITVAGIDMDETILKGGAGIAITVSLNGGATLRNLTVTRDNSGDWTKNANNTLVAFGSPLTADTILEDCILTHGRNGVYLNNSYGKGYKAIIRNNIIRDNRTGINFANNCNNLQIIGNTITDNWTIGIVHYTTAASDLSSIILESNIIKGNWVGQIFIKSGNPWDPVTALAKGDLDLEGNDLGGPVADGVETIKVAEKYNYAHAEPAYNDQQPASVGGTAVRPAWTPPTVRIYGYADAGVKGLDLQIQTYTDTPSGSVNAATESDLRSALVDDTVTTIDLTADISIGSILKVNYPVTINGAGHTITVAKSLGTDNSSKHALTIYADDVTVNDLTVDSCKWAFGAQAYKAENVYLNDVTLLNSTGAGLTVNGSSVSAINLNTSGNVWGGVNVDPGSGVTEPSIFTLSGNGALDEAIQIWSDGDHVSGTATVTVNADGYKPSGTKVIVWTKEVLPEEITDVDITGLTAPVAGAEPVTKGALTMGDTTYTVDSLTWKPAIATSTFEAGTTYTLTIILTSEEGYKFPAGGLAPTPTVDAGTVDSASIEVLGGDKAENQLKFDIVFPATGL